MRHMKAMKEIILSVCRPVVLLVPEAASSRLRVQGSLVGACLCFLNGTRCLLFEVKVFGPLFFVL